MNIMYIASDNYAGSGAFLSLVNLARNIREKYKENVLIVLPRKGDGEELLLQYSIPYIHIYSFNWCIRTEKRNQFVTKIKIIFARFFNIVPIISLIGLIYIKKIDIIHINTSYSYVGAIAGKICKKSVIWHIREFLEEDQGCEIWNKKRGYKLINRSAEIITISKAIYKKYENIFDVNKMQVILNGINERQFYLSKHHIFKNHFLRIAIIGTISYYKGQFCVVEAIDKLVKKGYKNLGVWIIGKGNDKIENELLDLINRKEVDKYISLVGYQKNIVNWLENIDIVLTCSKAEAFGRTTVEAMLAGCLVIGARSAGTLELIQENETGLLYQEGSADDLARQIERAINEKQKMISVAQNGQQYMLHNMTASINAQKIYKEYCKILKETNEKDDKIFKK